MRSWHDELQGVTNVMRHGILISLSDLERLPSRYTDALKILSINHFARHLRNNPRHDFHVPWQRAVIHTPTRFADWYSMEDWPDTSRGIFVSRRRGSRPEQAVLITARSPVTRLRGARFKRGLRVDSARELSRYASLPDIWSCFACSFRLALRLHQRSEIFRRKRLSTIPNLYLLLNVVHVVLITPRLFVTDLVLSPFHLFPAVMTQLKDWDSGFTTIKQVGKQFECESCVFWVVSLICIYQCNLFTDE